MKAQTQNAIKKTCLHKQSAIQNTESHGREKFSLKDLLLGLDFAGIDIEFNSYEKISSYSYKISRRAGLRLEPTPHPPRRFCMVQHCWCGSKPTPHR